MFTQMMYAEEWGLNMRFERIAKIVIASLWALTANSCLYLIADYTHEAGTFFPHEFHAGSVEDAKNDTCLECHKGMDKDKDTYTWKLPTKKLCYDCHDEDSEEPKKVTLRAKTDSIINFNHNWHVKGDPELNCVDCHEKVVTDEYLPVRGGYPKHEQCETCHGDWIPGPNDPKIVLMEKCKNCHKEKIMPRDHFENWNELHSIQAVGKWDTSCRGCHSDRKQCVQCHAGGVFRPESHDLAWERTHRFSVRNEVQNCKACHSDDSCQDCHRLRGVAGSMKYRQRMDALIHPPGWISDVPDTGNHHSLKARLELDTCKACHVPSDCKSCHFKRFPYGL